MQSARAGRQTGHSIALSYLHRYAKNLSSTLVETVLILTDVLIWPTHPKQSTRLVRATCHSFNRWYCAECARLFERMRYAKA